MSSSAGSSSGSEEEDGVYQTTLSLPGKGGKLDIIFEEDDTIADLKDILVSQFGYSKTVQLMHSKRVVKDDVFIDEFAPGDLVIVGQPQKKFEPEPARPAPAKAPVEEVEVAPSAPKVIKPQTLSKAQRQQLQKAAEAASAAAVTTITVNVTIPALDDRRVQIKIKDDSSVAMFLQEVVKAAPTTAGGKLLFFGKYVTDLTQCLRGVPLRDQSEVMVASGPFLSEQVMIMYLAAESIREVEETIDEAEGVKNLPKPKVHHCNDVLMKSLLKLDSLEDLEGEVRLRRKEYVKTITALQDALAA